MSKEEVAVEILKLCADKINNLEWKEKQQQSDYADRLAQAYNAIYAAISGPQDGK